MKVKKHQNKQDGSGNEPGGVYCGADGRPVSKFRFGHHLLSPMTRGQDEESGFKRVMGR